MFEVSRSLELELAKIVWTGIKAEFVEIGEFTFTVSTTTASIHSCYIKMQVMCFWLNKFYAECSFLVLLSLFWLPFLVCVRLLGLILIGLSRKIICQKGMIETKAVKKMNVWIFSYFHQILFYLLLSLYFLDLGKILPSETRRIPC